ncbi:hypothetical protein ES703_122406 [subsurface metagenome]
MAGHSKYHVPDHKSGGADELKLHELGAPTAPVDLNSQKLTNVGTPTQGTDAPNKDYIDSLVQGLDWQQSVIDKDLATPPGSPSAGDRYIVATGGTDAWVGHDDDIAEWDGAAWQFTTPNTGFACMVEDETKNYTFNGTAWVTFGSTVDHGALTGLGDDDHPQYTRADGTRAFTGDQAMGGNKVTGLGAPTVAGDAARKDEVDACEKTAQKGVASGYMGLDGGQRGAQSPKLHAADHKSGGADIVKLNELGAPTGPVAFNAQQAKGLSAPTEAGDAARKDEVDLCEKTANKGAASGYPSLDATSKVNQAIKVVQVVSGAAEPAVAAGEVTIWDDTNLLQQWLIYGTDGTVGGNKKVELT